MRARQLGDDAFGKIHELQGRNEKRALLINAYNAFTLRLILDHDAAQYVPERQRVLDAEQQPAIRWLEYDGRWNLRENKDLR